MSTEVVKCAVLSLSIEVLKCVVLGLSTEVVKCPVLGLSTEVMKCIVLGGRYYSLGSAKWKFPFPRVETVQCIV